MNTLDFVVLIGTILGIALFGVYRTRNRGDLKSYLKGQEQVPWYAVGLSVMATQASAVTFLSTPGQGFAGGLSFIQIYFGVPIALILVSIFFLPNFQKLNVYTAYEYLETRFDTKTRLLGTGLFLLQRGLGAGLTIYAPAIVVTSVFGWPLDLTILCCGSLVTIYTVMGGSDAVTVTQKYQLAVVFAGMITAACLLIGKLPADLSFGDTLHLAGGFQKLNAVNFSFDMNERYTFWSGILGGTFLMLSYFGTDQSQVQRYISGSSIRESRLGLMFNAVCKIPMQFCILFLGVLLFTFYQFNAPPLFFDPTKTQMMATQHDPQLTAYKANFDASHKQLRKELNTWLQAKKSGDNTTAGTAFGGALTAQQEMEKIRADAASNLALKNPGAKANEADYVFITFILHQLPHGVIGLLIAAFFAATLSSKSAELNALGTCSSIDLFRLMKRDATDHDCLKMAKWFTALWGVIAMCFALYAHLVENLIQAVNILGSIFYGVMLGLFVVAFFLKRVRGSAIFWSALVVQGLIFYLYFNLTISYLWYPLIGCATCVALSLILQLFFNDRQMAEGKV